MTMAKDLTAGSLFVNVCDCFSKSLGHVRDGNRVGYAAAIGSLKSRIDKRFKPEHHFWDWHYQACSFSPSRLL